MLQGDIRHIRDNEVSSVALYRFVPHISTKPQQAVEEHTIHGCSTETKDASITWPYFHLPLNNRTLVT